MAQANGIVLRIRRTRPTSSSCAVCRGGDPDLGRLLGAGQISIARLARVEYGTEEAEREDVAVYLLYLEVPGTAEHTEHDEDPRFKAYLEKVQALHAEPPLVFGGDILFERRAT